MNSQQTTEITNRIVEILSRELPEYDFEARNGSFTSFDCNIKINVSPK